MKILIIANPVSGGKKGKKLLPEIEKGLKNYNINYDLKKTEYHGHAEKIIEQTNIKQYDGVALIGGDGTNFQVLNGLIKNHDNNSLPPVAIIPAGSGDSFALDLGINNCIDGIKAIAENNIKPVDVLCFTSENDIFYCVNLIGIGFVTEVSKISENFKFFKAFSYILGVIYKTLFLKFYKIELTVNNKTISGEKCFVEFCNSKYTGGKMLMAPDAEIDDGFFDIVIASKISRFKLLKAFPKIFMGTHIDIDEITTIRTKKARLMTERPLSMNPDGEIFGTTPTEINILPKKLNYFYLK